MYCNVCGEKLALVVHKQEGLVPFCKKCGEYRFPQFATAVSMVVTNRAKDKILWPDTWVKTTIFSLQAT